MQFPQIGILLSRALSDIVGAYRRRVEADGGTFEGQACLQQEVNVLGNFYGIFGIIMVSNGYKANKLYALKPTNGDFDLAFTRATTAYRRRQNGSLESVATGVPRLNHRYGQSCADALLETGNRTNLLLRSQEFDNASWTKTNCTVTADAITAPDGTSTADAMFETVTVGQHRLEQAVSKATSVLAYCLAVYLKPNGRDWVYVSLRNGANVINQWFNITTLTRGTVVDSGTFIYSSSNMQQVDNGWIRLEMKVFSSNANSITSIIACTQDDASTADYAGDVTKGFYIWGAQLEQADFGSSYIPTTSASASRNRDVLTNKTGLGSYIGASGTIYFKGVIPFDSVEKRIVLTDGTSTKRIAFIFTTASKPRCYIENTTAQADITGPDTLRSESEFRAIITFATNSVKLFVNGIKVGEDTSASIPTSLDRVTFDDSSTNFYGSIKVLAISTTAITEAQALLLSTPVSYPAILKNIIPATLSGDPDYYGFGNGVSLDAFFPDYSIYLAKRGGNHVTAGGNGFGMLYNEKFNLWTSVFETIDDGTTYYSGHSAGIVGNQIFVQVSRYTVTLGVDTYSDIGYFTSVDLTTLTDAEDLRDASSWNAFVALPAPTYNRYEAYGKIVQDLNSATTYYSPWFEHNGTNHRLNIRKIVVNGIDNFTITNIQVHDSTNDYGEPSLVLTPSGPLLFARQNDGTEMIHLWSGSSDLSTWTDEGDTNLGTSSGDCVVDTLYSEDGDIHVIYQDRGNGFIMVSKGNTYAQCVALALNTPVKFEYNAVGDSLNGLGYPSIWEIRHGVFMLTWVKETDVNQAHVYYTLATIEQLI